MSYESVCSRALADNLAARLRACSSAEQQLIDRALGSLEGVRGADRFGRRWERRIATGPGDVDRSWHLVRLRTSGASLVTTPCRGSWASADACETVPNPPLEERCTACWRAAVQGDALALALIDAWVEIQAEERAKEAAHERARDEMVPRRPAECTGLTASWCPRCGDCTCGDREDATVELNGSTCALHAPSSPHAEPAPADRACRRTGRQTVSIGHVPGDGDPVEIPMARHLALLDEPDREVVDEFELDQHLTPGDAEEPLGVHGPGGELGGEGG